MQKIVGHISVKKPIFSKRDLPFDENICFVKEELCSFVTKLKQKEDKPLWICGGGLIAQELVRCDLIDEIHLTTIPILLGSGIRLFGFAPLKKFKLKECKAVNKNSLQVFERIRG